ncbi:hypothetical protein ILYODFUR_035902 [Ilyodon furcidens]|uniref:Uncharacterized protein n=1 Tax=Ilyodon furcidens TaxID=33524 RepID=A0ABV0UB75_9TELE
MVYIYIFSEMITRYSTNKSVVKVLTSCLSSVWSPGVREDPSDEEDLFSVGGIPHQITSAAIEISLQMFLLDVVQMKASFVSMILFLSRAWDAVTDPLVGYLVSCSTWTPIGKLTPWLVGW